MVHRSPRGGGLAVSLLCRRGLGTLLTCTVGGVGCVGVPLSVGQWVSHIGSSAGHVASLHGRVMLAVAPSGPGQSPDWPCPLGRRGLALASHALWGGLAASVTRVSVGQRSPLRVSAVVLRRPPGHLRLAVSSVQGSVSRVHWPCPHGPKVARPIATTTRPSVPRMWGETPPRPPRGGRGALVLAGPLQSLTAIKGGGWCPYPPRSDGCGWLPPHCALLETHPPPPTAFWPVCKLFVHFQEYFGGGSVSTK